MKSNYEIHHGKLRARYTEFQGNLDRPETDPVTVFDPLTPTQIEELKLIREVSLELQKKKEEDKAAQLAKQNATEVEEPSQEKKEEVAEEVAEKTE